MRGWKVTDHPESPFLEIKKSAQRPPALNAKLQAAAEKTSKIQSFFAAKPKPAAPAGED